MLIKRWKGKFVIKRKPKEGIRMGVSMAILQPITGTTVDKFLKIANQARATEKTKKKVIELSSMVEIED